MFDVQYMYMYVAGILCNLMSIPTYRSLIQYIHIKGLWTLKEVYIV